MPTLVRFRFNKVTGEVEEFLVDDQDRHLPEAEHDRIAADVGRFVAAYPRVLDVTNGGPNRQTLGRTSRDVGEALEGEGIGADEERPEVE